MLSGEMNREINKLRKLGLVPNTLHDILEAFPSHTPENGFIQFTWRGTRGYRWDILKLSKNPNIQLDYVLKNMNLDWSWTLLSKYMVLTVKDVFDHDNPSLQDASSYRTCLPWNYNGLTHNANLSPSDILDILESSQYCRMGYSEPPSITPYVDFIRFRSSASQIYEQYKSIFNFDKEKSLIQNIINNWGLIRYVDKDEFWRLVSCSSDIYFQDVVDRPGWPWDYTYLVVNPNVTINDIKGHFELPSESLDSRDANSERVCLTWDYTYLGRNPSIALKDIKDNPDLPWKWLHLAENKFEKDPVIAKRWIDKYKPKSEEFKHSLKIWKNHLKYQPDKEGYVKTKKSWTALNDKI